MTDVKRPREFRRDLTAQQGDYAIFLPALSGFYSTVWGNVVRDPDYADHNGRKRIPATIKSIHELNWLDMDHGLFTYKHSLYSAGHANLDPNNPDQGEVMIRERDRANTFILGDSGGFQIGKGRWPGEWRDPNSPEVQQKLADLKAQGPKQVWDEKKGKTVTVDPYKDYLKQLAAADLKRKKVLAWMDLYMDYGMGLDIPTWVEADPSVHTKIGVSTSDQALAATRYNIQHWISNRKGVAEGGCKFLNVLQGPPEYKKADDWYESVKEFCDPTLYPGKHFDGWAMGGQNMSDLHLALRRVVALIRDGLLEKGKQDWMHFLGTSRLDIALILTDIQRAVRRHHNENFTISFDCASPFLASANGQIYYNLLCEKDRRWSYQMGDSVDSRDFGQALLKLPLAEAFEKIKGQPFKDSPISSKLKLEDICTYRPGDKNKIDKVGKTSWDSYSYLLQMHHNVWSHIDAVQQSNHLYSGKPSEYQSRAQEFSGDIVDVELAKPGQGRWLPSEIDADVSSLIDQIIETASKGSVTKEEILALLEDERTYKLQTYELDPDRDPRQQVEQASDRTLRALKALAIVHAYSSKWEKIRGGRISSKDAARARPDIVEGLEIQGTGTADKVQKSQERIHEESLTLFQGL